MKPKEKTSSEEWLRQCVQVAKSVTQNEPHQAQGYLVLRIFC